MKPEILEKLSQLRQETENTGPNALHLVLHLLQAHYMKGTLVEFAKHCCAHTPVSMEAKAAEDRPVTVH